VTKQTFTIGQRVYVSKYGLEWELGTVTNFTAENTRTHWGTAEQRIDEYVHVEGDSGWTYRKLNNRRLILSESEYAERILPRLADLEAKRAKRAAEVDAQYIEHARALSAIIARGGSLIGQEARIASYLREHFMLWRK
jgi:hypothetical protein